MDSPSLLVARAAVRAGRAAWRALPASARKGLEDRVFYAVFQLTRVENDAYGWRPDRGATGPRDPPPAPPDPVAPVAEPRRAP